ncbi:hypothetical protein [Flavobacterium aestivum]|uniref:hypothetical protein n=1 Tax=Flavobacterium aestivum TaxID=3003257 RepID=UPI0024829509|nr:hypothetical protein [Flavobacterium aestivum]
MEYHITKQLLEKLSKKVDFDKLNSNQVPETFKYQNKCYVPVGSCSSGAKGIISVSCHEVIPLEKYIDDVEPKYNNQHYSLVLAGKRERGYHARLLKLGFQKFVLINPIIDFKPLKEEKQLNLVL